MENKYQEKSPIVCPQCGEKMDLITEGGQKIGVCKNCGYIEPNYGNWLNQKIHNG